MAPTRTCVYRSDGKNRKLPKQGPISSITVCARRSETIRGRAPPPHLPPLPTRSVANRAALCPLPSSGEMRMTSMWCIYFVNHKTRATTWDDPRLPSTGDADALHYALRARWCISRASHRCGLLRTQSVYAEGGCSRITLRLLCGFGPRPPQALDGQIWKRRRTARLWRHLARAVLPRLTRDVQPQQRPVRVFCAR